MAARQAGFCGDLPFADQAEPACFHGLGKVGATEYPVEDLQLTLGLHDPAHYSHAQHGPAVLEHQRGNDGVVGALAGSHRVRVAQIG